MTGRLQEQDAGAIDLPDARAIAIDMSYRGGRDNRDYLITHGERWFALVCGSMTAPEDRWLSIAESFDFLPAG